MDVRTGDEFTAFAWCPNKMCDDFDVEREVQMKWDVFTEHGANSGVIVTQTQHKSMVDDADYLCPECGSSRAISESRRREIPRLVG